VSASGPVRALVTVEVGSQLSGQVSALHADFNSIVRRDEVIAEIDPKTFEARVAQANADLAVAQATVTVQEATIEKAKAVLLRVQREVVRQRSLSSKGFATESALDVAETDVSGARADLLVAQAQLENAKATVEQRKAALAQAQIDLDRTKIRSPVDGIVIDRRIDIGQTVAASLQSPTLFLIAEDLSRIRIEAQVDEADIGNVKTGDPVTFTVDAYPDRSMSARVEQVRVAATEVQNVVTYTVIIEATNPDLELLPGMTANVEIVHGERENVLRVPNDALRFRPPQETAASSGAPGNGAKGTAGSGTAANVWVPGPSGVPQPRKLRVGLSDDLFTEVLAGPLAEQEPVIVRMRERRR
jgi:HlyD family secretion protein